MIDLIEARFIAQKLLDELKNQTGKRIMFYDNVDEYPSGWLFSFDSEDYILHKIRMARLAGGVLIFVDKFNGESIQVTGDINIPYEDRYSVWEEMYRKSKYPHGLPL